MPSAPGPSASWAQNASINDGTHTPASENEWERNLREEWKESQTERLVELESQAQEEHDKAMRELNARVEKGIIMAHDADSYRARLLMKLENYKQRIKKVLDDEVEQILERERGLRKLSTGLDSSELDESFIRKEEELFRHWQILQDSASSREPSTPTTVPPRPPPAPPSPASTRSPPFASERSDSYSKPMSSSTHHHRFWQPRAENSRAAHQARQPATSTKPDRAHVSGSQQRLSDSIGAAFGSAMARSLHIAAQIWHPKTSETRTGNEIQTAKSQSHSQSRREAGPNAEVPSSGADSSSGYTGTYRDTPRPSLHPRRPSARAAASTSSAAAITGSSATLSLLPSTLSDLMAREREKERERERDRKREREIKLEKLRQELQIALEQTQRKRDAQFQAASAQRKRESKEAQRRADLECELMLHVLLAEDEKQCIEEARIQQEKELQALLELQRQREAQMLEQRKREAEMEALGRQQERELERRRREAEWLRAKEVLEQKRSEALHNLLSDLEFKSYNLTMKVQGGHVKRLNGGCADIFVRELKDGKKIAEKQIRFSYNVDKLKVFQRVTRELRIWSKLDHDNVLLFKGFIKTEEYEIPSIVTEWMEHGSLRQFINNNNSVDSYAMIAGITNGIAYLHSKGVVHGDLKADNVVVSPDFVPKLMDFGISHLLTGTVVETATRAQSGSMRWSAPELYYPPAKENVPVEGESDGEDEDIHTNASDIWALGMTSLEVLTKRIPFSYIKDDRRILGLLSKKQVPAAPKNFSDWTNIYKAIWELCQLCWNYDAEQRPSAAELARRLVLMSVNQDENGSYAIEEPNQIERQRRELQAREEALAKREEEENRRGAEEQKNETRRRSAFSSFSSSVGVSLNTRSASSASNRTTSPSSTSTLSASPYCGHSTSSGSAVVSVWPTNPESIRGANGLWAVPPDAPKTNNALKSTLTGIRSNADSVSIPRRPSSHKRPSEITEDDWQRQHEELIRKQQEQYKLLVSSGYSSTAPSHTRGSASRGWYSSG